MPTPQSEPITELQFRQALGSALGALDLPGRRVLVIIPDATRTAPVPLLVRLLGELAGPRAAALDYLVALGTHPAMDDAALSRLVGQAVRDGRFERAVRAGLPPAHSRVMNHRWDDPATFAALGAIPAAEVRELSAGRLSLDVPVRVNRLVLEYERILICGPVFPHEVVGFSGGTKYFFPGVGGAEIIDATHWLGALATNVGTIGRIDTPVRRMIDRAAAMVPTRTMGVSLVMHGRQLVGIFAGEVHDAWAQAAELSARLDIVTLERPVRRVLSVMPEMYDDLWTAAKGMYKLEPVVADGGEVVIFAPHITEVSYTHGRLIDEVGYHVRDYFLKQWDRFSRYPWAVLAHSTHVRGAGTYEDGVERARIRVTLATGIPEDRCRRIGLGYLDPASVDLAAWTGREDEGLLLVPRAGEMLYRLAGASAGG